MLPKQAFGFVLLAISLIGTCRSELKAGCKLETVRACGNEYVPYGDGPSLPVSGRPLADKCATWKQSLNCASQYYKDCLQGGARVAVGVVVNQIEDITAAICNVGSEKNKEYEKSTPCLNSVGGKLHACFTNLKSDLHQALVKAPEKQVLPHACCSYDDAVHCFEQALAPCESVGGKRHFLGFLERVFGNVLKLACPNNTRTPEACKALAKLPSVVPSDPKIESYVEIFVSLVSHLKD